MIAVVSAWDAGMSGLASVVMPNHEDYCRRWGYASVWRDTWGRTDLHPVWAKWVLAAEVLGDYDWVFALDLDTLFMDLTRPLEDLLVGGADFLATVDIYGLNSGAVFVRNIPWAHTFLQRVIAAGPRFAGFPSTDQTAFAYLLYAEPRERWAVVPQRLCNSFLYGLYGLHFPEGEYADGDFLLHLPALPNARRVEVFRDYLTRVKR